MAATHKTDHWACWKRDDSPLSFGAWVHPSGWKLVEGAAIGIRHKLRWRIYRPNGMYVRNALGACRVFKTADNAVPVANAMIKVAEWKSESDKRG